MNWRFRSVRFGLGILLSIGFGSGVATAQEPARPVFQGEVRVDVVDLLVSVVDATGQPITGLKPGDFQVYQDGKPMDVTFFSDLGAQENRAPGSVGPADEIPAPQNRMILVFDRVSLEKKARKRALDGLRTFLAKELPANTLVMVTLVGGVDVVQPFTTDRAKVVAALDKVDEAEYTGDVLRGKKRILKRTMNNTQTMTESDFRSTGGSTAPLVEGLGLENSMGKMQADQYLDQVNSLREYEYARILGSLVDLETIVRGTAGNPGRRDIVWVGEDLFIKPGIDGYGTFFRVFQHLSQIVNIQQPEIWASQKELSQQFDAIAKLCQGMGATLHVLDASDRSRAEAGDTMKGADYSDHAQFFNNQVQFRPGDSRNMTFRQEASQAQNLTEGGHFLAEATGGTDLSGSRDVDEFFQMLGGIIGGTYWVGYDAPSGLDGQLHEVNVGVSGKGREVFSAGRVPAETVYHRLADLANAEMLLPTNENPLGFTVTAGAPEVQEDGSIIRSFRLVLPTDDIVFAENEAGRSAHLAVAVTMRQSDGAKVPASVFQLPVTIPADRFKQGSKVASSFRLKVAKSLDRVAVALRDELSGKTGSRSLQLAAQ